MAQDQLAAHFFLNLLKAPREVPDELRKIYLCEDWLNKLALKNGHKSRGAHHQERNTFERVNNFSSQQKSPFSKNLIILGWLK